MKNKVLKNTAHIIFLIAVSVLFSFGLFKGVDPFMFCDEIDPSCFYTIGHAIPLGKMPYVDFVDNKGPVTYLLYTLSSFLGKFPWGMMFISIVLLFVSLLFIKLICDKLDNKHSLLAELCFLFVYVRVYNSGGYTEDLSIPLILISFFVLVCFDKDCSQNKLKRWYGLVLSVLFWLCAMTRINNAVPIGVIALFVAIKMLCEKKYKSFLQYILTAVIASVIILTPVIIWLCKNGALTEAVNQCFINNFKYSDASTASSKSEIFFSRFGLLALLLCVTSVFSFVIVYIRNKEKRFLSVASIATVGITAISLISITHPYFHYLLILYAPAYFCSFILIFLVKGKNLKIKDKTIKNSTLSISIALIFCVLFMVSYLGIHQKFVNAASRIEGFFEYIHDSGSYEYEYDKKLNDLISNIPQEEKDSIFSIDVTPAVYSFTNTTPCKRIFICCDLFTDISPEYAEEFKGYFENNPPKWLITKVPLNEIKTCGLSEKLDSMYSFVDKQTIENDDFILYEINEAPT